MFRNRLGVGSCCCGSGCEGFRSGNKSRVADSAGTYFLSPVALPCKGSLASSRPYLITTRITSIFVSSTFSQRPAPCFLALPARSNEICHRRIWKSWCVEPQLNRFIFLPLKRALLNEWTNRNTHCDRPWGMNCCEKNLFPCRPVVGAPSSC